MPIEDPIILSIEVRRSCFGYAVFQGPKQLLDWGTTTPYPLDRAIKRAEKRLLFLLTMLPPAIVVMKKQYHVISRGPLLQFLKSETLQRSIPMFIFTRADVYRVFNVHDARNKDEIADCLVRIFPELHFKLPPKRETGDCERHTMLVFDAIATGYAYLQSAEMRAPPE